MRYIINDATLISEIVEHFSEYAKTEIPSSVDEGFVYPLDSDVIEHLKQLRPPQGQQFLDYSQAHTLDDLWIILVKKSISCLRFFDTREPFGEDKTKRPIAYGMNQLKVYHSRYTDFEGLLYGSSPYYRDHVFHAVRTWMLGIFCLLNETQKTDGSRYRLYQFIEFDAEKEKDFTGEISFFEIISMWTIISLCHDLGYPLEKSQQILEKTKVMMKEFIQNPNIWHNFGFTGSQDNINEYITKFLSTKMKRIEGAFDPKEKEKHTYLGRIQPKYYLKYAKSLDRFDHGIISSIILYKMLLYFVESDFNLNDDYTYKYQDARQFYIRREMLRAMASHTCSDIYTIHLATFSSLLFFCDELQEWGRKTWNSLYAGLMPEAITLTINSFDPSLIDVHESINMSSTNDKTAICKNIGQIYERQYLFYKLILRDGQYTKNRTIDFIKKLEINLENTGTRPNKVTITYAIRSIHPDYFIINNETPGLQLDLRKHFNEHFKNSDHLAECIFE